MKRRLRSILFALALFAAAPAVVRSQDHAMPPPPPAGPAPPLYTDLGTWTHPVTTTSREAQAYFDQGLRLCYGFNHAEAIRAFREAARLDPNCAMAWWGVAYAAGPNINMPMDEAGGTIANDAIARARALRSLVSEQDRAWIDALAVRYSTDPRMTRAGLDSAYTRAMKALAKRYPADADAGALHAESMLDLNPWNQWTAGGKANPGTREAVAELERVMKMSPNHPGANHFYIHAVEASPRPERATAAADRLGALIPGAGHIVHMPAHIYGRTARYDDAVRVNQTATALDEKFIAEQDARGSLYSLMYTNHNIHFIWFGAQIEGREKLAMEAARKLATREPPEVITQVPMIEFLPTLPMMTLARFSRWDQVLAEPLPRTDWRYASGTAHYARGLALAARGDVPGARVALDSLRAIAAAISPALMISTNSAQPLLRIATAALEGEIAGAEKRWDDAAARFAAAIVIEDGLKYDEPPTWSMPVRYRAGAVMLKAGRAKDAERLFREDLRRHPENGWSLRGLTDAQRTQGKSKEAAATEARFRKAWARADEGLENSTN